MSEKHHFTEFKNITNYEQASFNRLFGLFSDVAPMESLTHDGQKDAWISGEQVERDTTTDECTKSEGIS